MKLMGAIIAAVATVLAAGNVFAQPNSPNRPVRILVGFVAGGPADVVARVVAGKLSEKWSQPVVVENIAGAGGNVGGERVATSARDGYTLLMATNAQVTVNPSLYDKMTFNPLRDLATISQIVFTPNILVVNNNVPATNVQELVALARSRPGNLT